MLNGLILHFSFYLIYLFCILYLIWFVEPSRVDIIDFTVHWGYIKQMPYIEDMSTLITHFGLTFAQNCNDTPDIHVSIRFTYFLLNNLNTLVQRISLVDGKDHKLSKDSDSYQLPFGIAENSIRFYINF